MQTHLVFGAGLIGCFLGGVLTTRGVNTSLVCRPKIQKKLAGGLVLTDYQDNKISVDQVNFADPEVPSLAEKPDILWLTVKCTGVEQACEDIRPFVSPSTVIMCCQNGLGSDVLVKQAFPENQVLRVMVPFNVAEPAEGHFHRGSEGTLTIEVNPQNEELVGALINKVSCPIMPITSTTDMQALLWAKLQLNLGNSINALADIPVKAMLEQRNYRRVIAALMDELLMVTANLNVSLPKVTALPGKWIPTVLRLPDFVFKRVANKMLQIDPTVRTSMWWDLSQGKNTEIDHLNGAIVDTAKRLEVKVPVNQKIISLIKACEEGQKQGKQRINYSAKALLDEVINGKIH